jgi:hypothetical protein
MSPLYPWILNLYPHLAIGITCISIEQNARGFDVGCPAALQALVGADLRLVTDGRALIRIYEKRMNRKAMQHWPVAVEMVANAVAERMPVIPPPPPTILPPMPSASVLEQEAPRTPPKRRR